ncbi:MAG: phosphotransferase [Caldilineaceae bacterium]
MNDQEWIELAIAACNDAGVAHGPIEIITTWDQKFPHSDVNRNNAVFRIGDQRCLKLYGPKYARQFYAERSLLQTLAEHGQAIPAPRFIAAKERSQLPPYVVMTEVAGASLQNGWDDLTRAEQLALAREIGAITAAVQRLPQADLACVEQQVGGRHAYAKQMQAERIAQIEATANLSTRQRDALLHYLRGEALAFLDEPAYVTHSDFSHAHVYFARMAGTVKVTGFIDWAEAMLGPPEWDLAFHWFWTFSRDRAAMQECLKGYYPDGRLPERLARRCLSTHLYSFSMEELWPYFAEKVGESDAIVRDMTAFFFDPDVFGSPE